MVDFFSGLCRARLVCVNRSTAIVGLAQVGRRGFYRSPVPPIEELSATPLTRKNVVREIDHHFAGALCFFKDEGGGRSTSRPGGKGPGQA